jgi:hypothetical protein
MLEQRRSGEKQYRSSALFATDLIDKEAMARLQKKRLVVCIDDDGYPAALERRKIYVALPDVAAEKHGLIRVVDESGEDYLYSRTLFRSLVLPQAVRRAVLAAA